MGGCRNNVTIPPMLAEPAGTSLAAQWRQRDLAVLWHPCTQMREHPDTLPLLPIARGEGAWLIGFDGSRTLDAIAAGGQPVGHAEPRLAAGDCRQPARSNT